MRTTWIAPMVALLGFIGVAHAQVEPTAKRPSADEPPVKHSRFAVEYTSLNLMREKGIISEAEYESALRDIGDSAGGQAGEAPTLMLAKWSTTLYGFVEADFIYDTTESFNDLAGNAQVARLSSFANMNARMMFGARNSRIGLKMRAPEWHHIRASAMLEMDFLGNQPTTVTEAQFWTNPSFRIRHMNLKIETPIVDVLFGQYWQLFGWQSTYQPNTVQIQGVPGELYSRTPQIRISKTIKTPAFTFEAAAAIMRPPQRDSAYPELQGGVRFAVNKWTGLATTGSTGTAIQPLSVAVTADMRRFSVNEFSANPGKEIDSDFGWGAAVDVLIPVLRATKEKKGNALTINGEFAYGKGTADLYTGLTGGVTFPALPNPNMVMPAPVYTPNIDPGLVTYDATGALQLIQWTSVLAGLQYYFPGLNGRLWVSGNFSYMQSNNAKMLAPPTRARDHEYWADGNLFWDVTPAVRFGFEYAWFKDTYADGNSPTNHRVQFSAFYIF